MARQTVISPLNTLAMRPVDLARPAKYHHGHLDTEWQRDLILSFQEKAYYQQPMERGDRFYFESKCTANTSRTLTVLNCSGATVLTIALSATAAPAGDVTDYGDQYTTYLYKLVNLAGIAADGVYYFLFTVVYDTTRTAQFISEPVKLQNSHPDTIFLEASNSTNRDDILFEQLPIRMPLRVSGHIGGFNPASSDTAYEDQGENLVLLQSTAYRGWVLYVGDEGGIPDWMLDKLNRFLSLDYVLFDGKQYVKASAGAKWNQQQDALNPLYNADIEIREADNTERSTTSDATLDVFIAPPFPFAVYSAAMGIGTVANLALPAARVINNLTQDIAYLAALNAFASDSELAGTFARGSGSAGNIYQYQNGPGERYSRAAASVYSTFFGFNYISAGGITVGPTLSFKLAGAPCIVEWGDGAVTKVPYLGPVQLTISHAYPPLAGTFAVRIWGPVAEFYCTDPNRSGLSGTFPPGLSTINIFGGTFPGNTFDMSTLATTASSLRIFALVNAGLTNVTGFNSIFPLLKVVDISLNPLSSASVGTFIFRTQQNAGTAVPIISGPNAVLSVVQTPAVPLNAQGNYYKGVLTSSPFNWTVNS